MKNSLRPGRAWAATFLIVTSIALHARAGEPSWDENAVRTYLDTRTEQWLNWGRADRKGGTTCLSCHTTLPLALARPHLGAPTPPEDRLIESVKARVRGWDALRDGNGTIAAYYSLPKVGRRKIDSLRTESILNAWVLVNHDMLRNGGTLSAETKDALGHMWSTQGAGGQWLDFGLRPWEREGDYYGTALSVIAVAGAGRDYLASLAPEPKRQLAELRDVLVAGYADRPLHDRLFAAWASAMLPGILTHDQQQSLAAELLERKVGKAWAITALAKAPRRDETWKGANRIPADTPVDGYATALVVLVLKRLERAAESPELKQALRESLGDSEGWLIDNRVAEGQGPVIYPNMDRNPASDDPDVAMIGKFLRDAAAGYAVLRSRTPHHPTL